MTEISFDRLSEIRAEAENKYKNIGKVFCPYLNAQVSFNARGLEHIKFKGRNKARSSDDQYIRLRALPLAKYIVEKSHTLQGFQQRNEFVTFKSKKWNSILKIVTYYEFIAVMKGHELRVRVIVKVEEGAEPHFWSIIPFWKYGRDGNKVIHYGNPCED